MPLKFSTYLNRQKLQLHIVCTFLLVHTVAVSLAQSGGMVEEDLRKEWMVYADGGYKPYQEGMRTPVIYFTLDPGRYRSGSILRITSAKPFSLYLNHQLIVLRRKAAHIDLDSLQSRYRAPWQFGVHQGFALAGLSTGVVWAGNDRSLADILLRPAYYFLDFSILAVLILLSVLVLLFNNNPKLAGDYFNVVRLFSIQEREDALLSSRVLSSVNMLYYGFASLFSALVLLVLFRYGELAVPAAVYFKVSTLSEGFIQWLRLAAVIFFILMVKLWLLTLLGALFQIADKTAAQFYNYVRLVFFVFGLAGAGCLIFFMANVQAAGAYILLWQGVIGLLFFWVIMASLKLMSRTALRFFQLFSYLCTTELIPVVFIIKVLNS